MAKKKEARKTVLSERNQKLLEEICAEFGSIEEAQRDPDFVLRALLETLNKDKGNVSRMLSTTLDYSISRTALEDRREYPEEYLPEEVKATH
jgi:hypothetical protein